MEPENCFCCGTFKEIKFYPDLVSEPVHLCPSCLKKIGSCLLQQICIKDAHRALRNRLRKGIKDFRGRKKKK
jgi:hypothetical protein